MIQLRVQNIRISVLIALFLFTAISAYIPMFGMLRATRLDYVTLKNQLKDRRDSIEIAKGMDPKKLEAELEQLRKKLPEKQSIPSILDDLTTAGKRLDVRFVTIEPEEPKDPEMVKRGLGLKDVTYQRFPIRINLTSSYRNFGEFLDALEWFPNSFIVVRSLRIERDERLLPRLKAELTIDTHTLEK